MRIDRVTLDERYRRDLGDVTELAASIAMHGLMHPIVVTESGRLIAGQRRLEACRSLGWTDIKVTFAEGVTDAAELLRMERDENVCRKDMTPSEQIALGRALEELERPKAQERQAEAGRANVAEINGTAFVRTNESREDEKPKRFDTRAVVAPAVGMSTSTYSRAKQIITAAESGDDAAVEAVEEMDRTGKVTPAYEKWKGHKVNRATDAETTRDSFGVAEAEPKKTTVIKNYKGRKPLAAMEGAVATLSGLAMPMKTLTREDFADLDDEVRTRWTNELSEVLSTLRRVRDLIKENDS